MDIDECLYYNTLVRIGWKKLDFDTIYAIRRVNDINLSKYNTDDKEYKLIYDILYFRYLAKCALYIKKSLDGATTFIKNAKNVSLSADDMYHVVVLLIYNRYKQSKMNLGITKFSLFDMYKIFADININMIEYPKNMTPENIHMDNIIFSFYVLFIVFKQDYTNFDLFAKFIDCIINMLDMCARIFIEQLLINRKQSTKILRSYDHIFKHVGYYFNPTYLNSASKKLYDKYLKKNFVVDNDDATEFLEPKKSPKESI
jgi:hypothetical protein